MKVVGNSRCNEEASHFPLSYRLSYQPLTWESDPALLPEIYQGGTKTGPDRAAEIEPSNSMELCLACTFSSQLSGRYYSVDRCWAS